MKLISKHILEKYIPQRNFDGDKEDTFIEYNGQVFIIEIIKGHESNGRFQYDGTACRQGYVEGLIFKKFKTKSKWFNSTYWYKKTSWGKDYPKRLFFNTDKNIFKENGMYGMFGDMKVLDTLPVGPERTAYINENAEKWNKFANKLADEQGRPTDKILQTILNEVKNKTEIKFELNFKSEVDSLDYGNNWWEAYIPLKYNNKKYLLTWENSD